MVEVFEPLLLAVLMVACLPLASHAVAHPATGSHMLSTGETGSRQALPCTVTSLEDGGNSESAICQISQCCTLRDGAIMV